MHWKDIIIELFSQKLGMMLSEVFQMKTERVDIDISDCSRHQLLYIILREISSGDIVSVHVSRRESLAYIYILEQIECTEEIRNDRKFYNDHLRGKYKEKKDESDAFEKPITELERDEVELLKHKPIQDVPSDFLP